MSTLALERSKTYFEQFVLAVPDPFKGLTQAMLWPFEQLLELVSGDPDDLMRAAQILLDASTAASAIADQQLRDRGQLRHPAWSGPSADAFHQAMADIEESIRELEGGLKGAKDVLVEAANASADAFNLLLELIFEFLVAFLIEAIIAAAAAALSFGASVAAFVVRWLARLAVTLGRGLRIVSKLAQALGRLASKLDDVAKLLTKYRERVMELRKLKKQHKPWTAAGRSAAGRDFWKEYFKKVIAPKTAFNLVSPVNLPGKFGAGLDTALGAQDISDGKKDRTYVKDGTYSKDLGPYTSGIQNIIDTVA